MDQDEIKGDKGGINKNEDRKGMEERKRRREEKRRRREEERKREKDEDLLT